MEVPFYVGRVQEGDKAGGKMEEKTQVAALSVFSNTVLTIGKLSIGFFSGSVSIVSEGIHSGIDLLAAVIALFAVRHAGRPADDRHAYGHGKLENVSGTIEAVLIFFAAVWIIAEAVRKITAGDTVEEIGLGLVIMIFSALLNLVISTMLMRVARKTNSVALEADALHLRTDVYTSAGVFTGLLLLKLTGWSILDPLVAIAVAVLIIKAAFDLTKEAFMPLIDASLPEPDQAIITQVLTRHAADYVEFHALRTRRSGAERHIDLHLVVPKHDSVGNVHELCDRIEEEINEQLPGTHVLIHAEPCGGEDETCAHCEQTCHGRPGKILPLNGKAEQESQALESKLR